MQSDPRRNLRPSGRGGCQIRQADPLLLARAAEWRSIMQGGMPNDYCTVHHPTDRLLRDEPTTSQA